MLTMYIKDFRVPLLKMAVFKPILVVCAAQLLWQTANGVYSPDDPSAAASGKIVSCLTPLNEARGAVGFKKFTENENILPATSKKDAQSTSISWEGLCSFIRVGQSPPGGDWKGGEGLLAFYSQSSENAECEAATLYWKSGYSLFGTELPPKYSSANIGMYKDNKASSFVALYNPKGNAAVQCALVTCPRPQGGDKTYGLVCVTTPKPLEENEYPYTEAQWKQITDAFASSGSVASPTLLAFAAVVAGLSLL